MSARSHSPLVLITSLECASMSSPLEEWSSLMSEAANDIQQWEITGKQTSNNTLWLRYCLQKLHCDERKQAYQSEGMIQRSESSSEHRRGRCRWLAGRCWPLWLVYHRIPYLCCVGTHMEFQGNCLHPCWKKENFQKIRWKYFNKLLKDPKEREIENVRNLVHFHE